MTFQRHRLLMLGLFMLVCFSAEFIGGLFTQQSVHSWYLQLIKPTWTPPAFVFAPVWTLLYFLMAISIWLIWDTISQRSKNAAYVLFSTQLILNMLWSALFFSMRSPSLALIDISFLWLLIVWMIVSFHAIRPSAAYFQIPYLLWTSYAWALNFSIWQLNR